MLQGIRLHIETGILPMHSKLPYFATKIINKSKKYCHTNYFSRFFIEFYCYFNTFTMTVNPDIIRSSMIYAIAKQSKISLQWVFWKYLCKLGRQISSNRHRSCFCINQT